MTPRCMLYFNLLENAPPPFRACVLWHLLALSPTAQDQHAHNLKRACALGSLNFPQKHALPQRDGG